MNKSEYLKKYLSDDKDISKKKVKKSSSNKTKPKPKGLTIIDEDIDLKKIAVKNNLDLYIEDDDNPLLVNVDKDGEKEENRLSKFTVQNWSKDEKNINLNNSNVRNNRHDSDSEFEDLGLENNEGSKSLNNNSPRRKQQKERHKTRSGSSSSDISPPRKYNKNADENVLQHETDISPPRRHANYDSDNSPPRKIGEKNVNQSPDGKSFKSFKGILGRKTEEIEVVYRDKSGKKRDFEKEKREKELKEAQQKEKEDKYNLWGKGLKQKEIKEAQICDVLHEVNKPLARYADDQDLDDRLKVIEREGDPMLEYMQKKKSKGSKGASNKPIYKGPEPMPNRFNIRPGYRWDGVDRSNGFEKQFFLKQNDRKALRDMAYKWSTEDM